MTALAGIAIAAIGAVVVMASPDASVAGYAAVAAGMFLCGREAAK